MGNKSSKYSDSRIHLRLTYEKQDNKQLLTVPHVVSPLPTKHKIKDVLYVLESADGKYYVGVTDDLVATLIKHIAGGNSEWINRYNINNLLYFRTLDDPSDEDRELKKLMIQHGIDNVRGGSYSDMNFTDEQRIKLCDELLRMNHECFLCKQKGGHILGCREDNTLSYPQKQNHTKKFDIAIKSPKLISTDRLQWTQRTYEAGMFY